LLRGVNPQTAVSWISIAFTLVMLFAEAPLPVRECVDRRTSGSFEIVPTPAASLLPASLDDQPAYVSLQQPSCLHLLLPLRLLSSFFFCLFAAFVATTLLTSSIPSFVRAIVCSSSLPG
jgi:hypothetical protein